MEREEARLILQAQKAQLQLAIHEQDKVIFGNRVELLAMENRLAALEFELEAL